MYRSHPHIRKFKDAIKFGAKLADVNLSLTFDNVMREYLAGFKKELVKEKKKGLGRVDSHCAYPVTYTLYQKLLQWALEQNNVIVWH